MNDYGTCINEINMHLSKLPVIVLQHFFTCSTTLKNYDLFIHCRMHILHKKWQDSMTYTRRWHIDTVALPHFDHIRWNRPT